MRTLLRSLVAWTAATVATAATTAWLLPVAIAPAARPDTTLVRLCAGVAALVAAGLWAATSAAVVVTALSPGGRRPDRLSSLPISEVLR